MWFALLGLRAGERFFCVLAHPVIAHHRFNPAIDSVVDGTVTTTDRPGIASLVAGAFGLAGISAATRGAGRHHEGLACGNDQSECTADDQCCSGICRLKPGSGTEYRCVGKKKKKKDKKDEDKDTGGDGTCGISQDRCTQASECCGDLLCDLKSLRCCVQVNNTCQSDADCCDSFFNACINGTCSTNN